jgi:hypothetical protein
MKAFICQEVVYFMQHSVSGVKTIGFIFFKGFYFRFKGLYQPYYRNLYAGMYEL